MKTYREIQAEAQRIAQSVYTDGIGYTIWDDSPLDGYYEVVSMRNGGFYQTFKRIDITKEEYELFYRMGMSEEEYEEYVRDFAIANEEGRTATSALELVKWGE